MGETIRNHSPVRLRGVCARVGHLPVSIINHLLPVPFPLRDSTSGPQLGILFLFPPPQSGALHLPEIRGLQGGKVPLSDRVLGHI